MSYAECNGYVAIQHGDIRTFEGLTRCHLHVESSTIRTYEPAKEARISRLVVLDGISPLPRTRA